MAVLLVAVGIGTPASAHYQYDSGGIAVAIDGDTAVVGVPSAYEWSGVAHIYARLGTEWVGEATLTHPDGKPFAAFGHSVAVDGDTVVIGAASENEPNGAAHVFVRTADGWMHESSLLAPPERELRFFGWSVAVEDDTAIIGAKHSSHDAAGGAIVFTRSNGEWSQQADLLDDLPAPPWFGWDVALDGDTAVVGAPFDDGVGPQAGSAYVFARTGAAWQLEEILTSPSPADDDHFGFAIDIDADAILVGAHPEWSLGSAHVFRRSAAAWEHEASMTGGWSEGFGFSVALDGDRALVGAPDDSERGPAAGAIHIFDHNDGTWTREGQISLPDGWEHTAFGHALAMDQGLAIAAALFHISFLDDSVFSDSPPIPGDDAYVITEDQTIVMDAPGVLANDTDPDGDEPSAMPDIGPSSGSLSLASDGAFTYIPDADFFGSDQFRYRVCSAWRCATAWAQIEVIAENDPPVAYDQAVTAQEDGSITIRLMAADVETGVSYHLSSQPGSGTLDGSAPVLTYDPNADFHGTDSFTFRAFDGELWSDDATVSITVQPVNDPPEALDDSASTGQYDTVNIDVLANDTDIDGDPLEILDVSQPEHGTVEINPDGTINYTPHTGFKDVDTFTYRIADPDGGTASAKVTIAEIGCGENGAQALDGTPAEGAASETIDREVEPLAGRHDRASAEAIHDANCTYVVAIEDQIDGL